MIHNEAKEIRARLAAIKGVQSVTRGWPKRLTALPVIAIHKSADAPVTFRDDREHIAELEYTIRIFTDRAEDADAIAVEVDAVMENLGYVRTFSYDDDAQDVRMDALRYRKYV